MPNSFDRRSRCFSSAVTRLIRQERGAERRGEAGFFSVRSCATSALCGRFGSHCLGRDRLLPGRLRYICGATRGSISVCASRAPNQRLHHRKGLSYFCCRSAQSRGPGRCYGLYGRFGSQCLGRAFVPAVCGVAHGSHSICMSDSVYPPDSADSGIPRIPRFRRRNMT